MVARTYFSALQVILGTKKLNWGACYSSITLIFVSLSYNLYLLIFGERQSKYMRNDREARVCNGVATGRARAVPTFLPVASYTLNSQLSSIEWWNSCRRCRVFCACDCIRFCLCRTGSPWVFPYCFIRPLAPHLIDCNVDVAVNSWRNYWVASAFWEWMQVKVNW